jgi:hypothetical protein
MTDQDGFDVNLSIDEPRQIAPDGTIYEMTYTKVEETEEEQAERAAEEARQTEILADVQRRLVVGGLDGEFEVFGASISDGVLKRIDLHRLSDRTSDARIAETFAGITVRYR